MVSVLYLFSCFVFIFVDFFSNRGSLLVSKRLTSIFLVLYPSWEKMLRSYLNFMSRFDIVITFDLAMLSLLHVFPAWRFHSLYIVVLSLPFYAIYSIHYNNYYWSPGTLKLLLKCACVLNFNLYHRNFNKLIKDKI